MNKLYIIPMVESDAFGKTYRNPKYLDGFVGDETIYPDSGLEGVRWVLITYSNHNTSLIHCILSSDQHAILSAKPDILPIPDNLDAQITSNQIIIVTDFFNGKKIPTGWITTNHTYRQVMRIMIGMFFFVGRLGAKTAIKKFLTTYPLTTLLKNIPTNVRTKLENVADSFSIDYSSLTGDDNLKDLIILVGKHWKNKVLDLGGYEI